MTRGPASSPVGGAVRAARTRLGWSRETLAHESGLSWAAITQIETGRRTEVRLSSLVALAQALGVSLDYLARGYVPPTMLEHSAYVFTSAEELVDLVQTEARAGLQQDHAVLVVCHKPKLERIRTSLGQAAKRVQFALAKDWYTTPVETTARYETFAREGLERGASWIDIFGEPGWGGRSAAETDAWARYESTINLVFAPWPATVRCLYDVNATSEQMRASVERTHPEVANGGELLAVSSYEEPMQFVTT